MISARRILRVAGNGALVKSSVVILLMALGGLVYSSDTAVLHKIVVNRSNIFEAGAAQAQSGQSLQLATSFINQFHITTLESVILREIGISEGDIVQPATVADVERRLRRLGIFATVEAELITTNEGVELHIDTRDNFSIIAGASGSFLGGVGNVGLRVGDRNLFGSGNNLTFSFSRNTTDNFRGSLAFSDLHFFNKPWRANYRIGRTDEGDFYGVTLGDPFRSLDDTNAWTVTADQTEQFIRYYEGGDVVVQLPRDRAILSGSYVWRSGNQQQYIRRGLVGGISQTEYSAASGVASDTIDVPANNTMFSVGGLVAVDTVTSFVKAQGLDTLNFVQDITLGGTAELQLGVNHLDETNNVERTEPTVSLVLDRSLLARENTFLRFTLSGTTIFEESGENPWSATAQMKTYYTGIPNNTVAARFEYSTGEDGSDLPVQLTLGENNGLRGYDTRQFEGRQRARINLESRYRPGWKFSVVDIGLVGFFDSGWAAERDESSLSVRHSVGAGLRFGSNALLGGTVLRLDVAYPLNPPDNEDDDVRVSFAVGQVFRF